MASDDDRDLVSRMLGTIIQVKESWESEVEDEKLGNEVSTMFDGISDFLEDWQYNEGAEEDDND